MPKLICLSGMNKGDEYELAGGENSIGRSEENSICIFDKRVSRFHCKVHIDGKDIVIEDLNSTNGSRVNNVFITGKKELSIGDHVRLGQTVFLLSDRAVTSENISDSSQIARQKKYENLLQETAFQVTKTTALRKLKTDKDGRQTGFLSFFKREKQTDPENSD